MTEKREPDAQDKRLSDDLEVPDEVAEDVKGGGQSIYMKTVQKLAPNKIK